MRRACRLLCVKHFALSLSAFLLLLALPVQDPESIASSDTPAGVRPLLVADDHDLPALLPKNSQLLIEAEAIEAFLETLEETLPDWSVVYGRGHHDPQFDERLFQLNRNRDERRRGNVALRWRITFIWPGELSQFDPGRHGFPVAIGPDFIHTGWGKVRFKPAEVPSNLTAGAAGALRERLIGRIEKGEVIPIKVAMTGHLITEESVIYDFSHEEEGQGLIMPVVEVEQVDYLLAAP
ncbi:MAG TPA: hypothetical protein VFG71_09615 [Nitrospiraceae bacterium]|nr:hypothetical protein [Nitrospiraceae bacterium]